MDIDWYQFFVIPFVSSLLPWLALAIGAGLVVIVLKKLLSRLFRR